MHGAGFKIIFNLYNYKNEIVYIRHENTQKLRIDLTEMVHKASIAVILRSNLSPLPSLSIICLFTKKKHKQYKNYVTAMEPKSIIIESPTIL